MNADGFGAPLAHLGDLTQRGFGGLFSVLSGTPSHGLDLSIEGMRSQQFSVGVFFFLVIGVLVFSGIIYVVAFGRFAPKTMKRGEKVMFAAIIVGTILAVVFGGMQLLTGDLF